MKVSVIISYYKALDNLKLILTGLQRQSDMRFEVIISEDDNNIETVDFLSKHEMDYDFPIVHLHQNEDLGFRKTMMLNKSIRASSTDFLIFIDGDYIPARHFVKSYISNAEIGYILWGRRVMLGEKFTTEIKEKKSISIINLTSILLSDSDKKKDGIYFPIQQLSLSTRGLVGCNWGIMKKHLEEINGFDEDYVHATAGEDSDIEWRLLANSLRKKSMRNKAIVYHLHHPRSYSRKGIDINKKLLQNKKDSGLIKCANGLEKLHKRELTD